MLVEDLGLQEREGGGEREVVEVGGPTGHVSGGSEAVVSVLSVTLNSKVYGAAEYANGERSRQPFQRRVLSLLHVQLL